LYLGADGKETQTGKPALHTGDLGIRIVGQLFHFRVQCSILFREAFAEIFLIETRREALVNALRLRGILLMEIE
jgi:hypothetical protein